MKLRYLLTTAAIAAMALPAVASAQVSCDGSSAAQSTCSLTNTLSATAPNILRLTISTSGSGTDLATALPNPIETDYDNYGDSKLWPQTPGYVTVTARANRKYYVTATAGSWQFKPDATFQVCWDNTGTYGTAPCDNAAFSNVTKSQDDLGIIVQSGTTAPDNTITPVGMSSAFNVIGSSGAGATPTATPDERYVWYRAGWNYGKDVAGEYQIVVTYTITGF